MTFIRAVEFTLIRTIGFLGEKALMSFAARDFMQRRELADFAAEAFDPDPAPVVPFWGCRVHHRAGPCTECLIEAEFPADNRQSAGNGPEVGRDAVPAVAPTSGPLTPECEFAAAMFPQHTK